MNRNSPDLEVYSDDLDAPSRIGSTSGDVYSVSDDDTLSESSEGSENQSKYETQLREWEKKYSELDRAASSSNFTKADKLCELLCDESRWDRRILVRPWSKMPDDKIRPWHGNLCIYPNAYRIIDGIREAWICLLMDYCKWERAVRIVDVYIYDDRCMYLTGKAQMALNKLHALLESRRMREAFNFFQQLLDGTPRMNEILRCVERMQTYQWHYSLARIHFLHNELEKAQHHAEMACAELDKNKHEEIEEPLQSRMWVYMIRAWTTGLTCVVSKCARDVDRVLDLWERTVCDLDRKSVQSTIGLKMPSVFGRLKFLEFLMIAVRAFPELEINSYADVTRPENSNVISIGKALLCKLRSITHELINRGNISVEVTNHRYHPLVDQALTQLGYLSTSLEGLLNNWALVIDAGPVGNEGRYANHTDDPNAVLAIGEASGIRCRVLRAIKPIKLGDEITVHYGTNYWDTVAQNRKSTISMKYDSAPGTSSTAPSIERAPKRAKTSKSGSSTSASAPLSEDFYAFSSKYEFKFFDGIVSDLNGSGLPALVLLQTLGELGTSSDASDMEASCRKKGLKIVDCPPDHAAYPGKMLVAEREFSVGEQITIYAGIMSRMPEAQLKLNESDYISTVCQSCCGPYGFELEDVEARNGPVFKKFQRDLPTLTPLTAQGRSIPNADPPVDMSAIQDIRGIGPECTRKLVDALTDDSKRDVLVKLLKRLRNLPDKQWKMNAQVEIRKAFASRPVQPPQAASVSERVKEEHEYRMCSTLDDMLALDSILQPFQKPRSPPGKRLVDKGLDGNYWGTTEKSRIPVHSGPSNENRENENLNVIQ